MDNESSIRCNSNRKRGPLAGSLPATSSSPLASSTSVERQDTVVDKMPTTPEQLKQMISTRTERELESSSHRSTDLLRAVVAGGN